MMVDSDEALLLILRLGGNSAAAAEVVFRGKECPKKAIPLGAGARVALLSQGDRLQVLDPDAGSLVDLECLVGESVSDACRFPSGGGSSFLVVVTASGRALKVDWQRDEVVAAVDDNLRVDSVEQSEDCGMSPVRAKGKRIGADRACLVYVRHSLECVFRCQFPSLRQRDQTSDTDRPFWNRLVVGQGAADRSDQSGRRGGQRQPPDRSDQNRLLPGD